MKHTFGTLVLLILFSAGTAASAQDDYDLDRRLGALEACVQALPEELQEEFWQRSYRFQKETWVEVRDYGIFGSTESVTSVNWKVFHERKQMSEFEVFNLAGMLPEAEKALKRDKAMKGLMGTGIVLGSVGVAALIGGLVMMSPEERSSILPIGGGIVEETSMTGARLVFMAGGYGLIFGGCFVAVPLVVDRRTRVNSVESAKEALYLLNLGVVAELQESLAADDLSI